MKVMLQLGTVIAAVAFIMGCSGSKSTTPVETPPNVPSNPWPPNDTTNQGLTDTLKWTGGDKNTSDTVRYTVYFDTSASSTKVLASDLTAASVVDTGLGIGVTYYWKVIAYDDKDTTSGPVWKFTTSTKRPPPKPTLLTPADSAKKQLSAVQLSWSDSDLNAGDTLRYDVYLDVVNPPVIKVSSSQLGATYSAASLTPGTTYYWKIIASDGNNATASNVWLFTTDYAPTIPSVISPANGATNQNPTLTLSWASSDADSVPITYAVYFDTVNPPIQKDSLAQSASTIVESSLKFGATYYWSVTATDGIDTIKGPVWSFTVKNAPGMRFIQGGTFQMGSTGAGADADESPVHTVTLSSFWIDTTDVTQADFLTMMNATNANPSMFKNDSNPVETVTWYYAALYCNARSKRDGLDTIYSFTGISTVSASGPIGLTNLKIDTNKIKNGTGGYHLPTEAQWEYACRAGSTTTTTYYWGNAIDSTYCWYFDNSNYSTHPVATKKPNAWGLYDMSGNVLQWCNDYYYTYPSGTQTNPLGPAAIGSDERVLRGGSFFFTADSVTSAFRIFDQASNPDNYIYGFRCAR